MYDTIHVKLDEWAICCGSKASVDDDAIGNGGYGLSWGQIMYNTAGRNEMYIREFNKQASVSEEVDHVNVRLGMYSINR